MNESLTTYRKSNELVSAKYKSSLLENKVMAIALSRIEMSDDNALEAKLYPMDLTKVISDEAHIYRDLKKLAKRITGHTIVLEDGKGNFQAMAMIPNADYEDGVFTLKFNKKLTGHVLGLEKNFTKLSLPTMLSFENVNTFRLYELFRKDFYKAEDGKLDIEYNISELKFIIGIANSDNVDHKNRLADMGNNIDWDKLYDALDNSDKKYNCSTDFKKWVLDVAKTEMDAKANISFTYEDGSKRGRKPITIKFHLYENTPTTRIVADIEKKWTARQDEENRQYELPADLYPEFYKKYVGHNEALTDKDLTILLQKADFDLEKVERAIKYADEYSEKNVITSYMGLIIRCIEENWVETPVANGSVEQGKKVIEVVDAAKERTAEENEAAAKNLYEAKKNDAEKFEAFKTEFLAQVGFTVEQCEAINTAEAMMNAYGSFIGKRKIKVENLPEVIDAEQAAPKKRISVKKKAKAESEKNPKKTLWENAKQKDEFPAFLELLQKEFGYELDDLEAAFTYDQLFEAFKSYNKGEDIVF